MTRLSFFMLAVLLAIAATAQTIFPARGDAPAEFNTGKVHISVLSSSERQMTTNFLFERGSRNSWHYHPNATQVLMVLSGEAYYQEEGKPKQLLRKGDVVTTAPNVRHWNGATPWSDCECMTVSDIVPDEQHAVQLRKVTDEEFASPITHESMIVRLAEIEVYPEYLTEYLACANEVDRLSVEREPGVICLYPMQSTEDSTQIRILEIYASNEAYQQHLQTEHFQKYKQGTLHMVKSLKLPTMQPLDPETMKLIFTKQR
ncbi:MAG: antibiotic biosynthesis monooxygenase [Muribaculaceae bacterium]|nr:antibiotic biosynthesis monooxygenase [Muribaculaceae bacterium]